MPIRQDLTGKRFTRLLVLEAAGKNKNGKSVWKCLCDCGNIKITSVSSLNNGDTRSCGCWNREKLAAANVKHGAARTGALTPEFRSWMGMRARCYNPKSIGYKNYGGRGIAVCEAWRNDFRTFLADVGPKPSPRHSLDRIDNDGNYEPGNCKWSTPKEQVHNRRWNASTLDELYMLRNKIRQYEKLFGSLESVNG